MEDRVVVWAPARDARLTCGFLTEKGFACVPCVTWDEFRSELQAGAGAAVIAAEFVTPSTLGDLEAIVSAQPPWSDLPVILVAGFPPRG